MGTAILQKTENKVYIDDIIFKYAVLAKICRTDIDESILPIKTIGDELKNCLDKWQFKRCSEQLLILFGDGVIDEDTLAFLLKRDEDIHEDVCAAIKYVLDKTETIHYDKLSGSQIGDILKCCCLYKKSPQAVGVGFEEMRSIMGDPHVALKQGAVKITDTVFLLYLLEADEPTGVISKKESVIVAEKENFQREKEIDPESEYNPCIIDLTRFAALTWLFGKPFAVEFLKYARENNIPLDEHERKYTDYLKYNKLHFEISSFPKKRNICQGVTNRFDYVDTAGENIMTPERTEEIDLEVSETLDDEQLLQNAFLKFAGTDGLAENTIVKIIHAGKDSLYVIKNRKLVPVDSRKFSVDLFDFNNIWTVVKECSHQGQIKFNGTAIVVPHEISEKIPKDQMKYAEELIREQYHLNEQHRKPNKLLSVLKSDAQKAYLDMQKTKAAQAKNAEKRDNRKNPVGGLKLENTCNGT